MDDRGTVSAKVWHGSTLGGGLGALQLQRADFADARVADGTGGPGGDRSLGGHRLCLFLAGFVLQRDTQQVFHWGCDISHEFGGFDGAQKVGVGFARAFGAQKVFGHICDVKYLMIFFLFWRSLFYERGRILYL